MTNSIRLVLAAAIFAPISALASDTAATLSAGRWEQVIKGISATVAGRALPQAIASAGNKTKFSCISPAEAKDPARFFKRTGAASADCGEPSGTVGNGRVALKATCQRKGTEMVMTAAVSGTYSAARYHLDADATMPTPQGDLLIKVAIDGRHVGACTGDEE